VSRRHHGPVESLRLRRRSHPVHWVGAFLASIFTVFAWSAVAHSSGSGWVQAVGAMLAAVLATGLLAPYLAIRGVRVTCTECPSDTVTGRSTDLTVTTTGAVRIRPLVPWGPEARAEGRATGTRTATVTLVPSRRGVLRSVAVEIASCSPFGIVWWAREVMVPLPRPLHVAPRLGTRTDRPKLPDDSVGDALRRVPAVAGEPKGVRPYQPGDGRRTVHWPATSHTGLLMVRESEAAAAEPVVVEVSLPADPDDAERLAERSMAEIAGHLEAGRGVVVASLEDTGPTVGPVHDLVGAGRRLARAVAPGGAAPGAGIPLGAPWPPPSGPGVDGPGTVGGTGGPT